MSASATRALQRMLDEEESRERAKRTAQAKAQNAGKNATANSASTSAPSSSSTPRPIPSILGVHATHRDKQQLQQQTAKKMLSAKTAQKMAKGEGIHVPVTLPVKPALKPSIQPRPTLIDAAPAVAVKRKKASSSSAPSSSSGGKVKFSTDFDGKSNRRRSGGDLASDILAEVVAAESSTNHTHADGESGTGGSIKNKKKKGKKSAGDADETTSNGGSAMDTSDSHTTAATDGNTTEASDNKTSLKHTKHRRKIVQPTAEPLTTDPELLAALESLGYNSSDPLAPGSRPLNKKERRKLLKLAEAKVKKSNRTNIIHMLQSAALTQEQHRLLVSTTRMGQRVTLKQQLRRKFIEEKAGISTEQENGTEEHVGGGKRKVKDVSLHQSIDRPVSSFSNPPAPSKPLPASTLDFFASTISPHIHPPKSKPKPALNTLPAAQVQFSDEFGAFEAAKRAASGKHRAGYIKAGKNTMEELEREQREREEEEEEEEDEEDEDEDEDEDDDEEDEDEDEDGEDDEDEEEDDEEDEEDDNEESEDASKPSTSIYTVAFDVLPLPRTNKKKRKRIVISLPGQNLAEKDDEKNDMDEDEEHQDQDADQMDMDDENDDDEEVEDDSDSGSGSDQPPAKKPKSSTKQKKTSAANPSDASEDDANVDVDADPSTVTPLPRQPRHLSRIANQAAPISKDTQQQLVGRKFSRQRSEADPSTLWVHMQQARKEQGGEVRPYPGTAGTHPEEGDVLSQIRVSNNAEMLGDREEGKPLDKGKKKGKASTGASSAASSARTVVPRMPTIRTTPSGKVVVEVHRSEAIQAARLCLPICSQEQEIMECIEQNDVVILSGETGSGKTTQVPQFLFEAGYGLVECGKPGLIGVTEPRRVAAIATAQRVAHEINVWNPDDAARKLKQIKRTKERAAATRQAANDDGDATAADPSTVDVSSTDDSIDGEDMTLVSYQVRYSGMSTAATRIKFMTDGILLREVSSDFLLGNYSAILIDEAHERGINSDLLIGILSRLIPLRNKKAKEFAQEKARRISECRARGVQEQEVDLSDLTPIYPLKLIIMSATLRLSDFTENAALFPRGPPPVLSIDTRQYPVSVHFHRFTPLRDYARHMLKMLLRMHSKLPMAKSSGADGASYTGGILVFLPGKEEIEWMVREVRRLFEEKRTREEQKKIKLQQQIDEATTEEQGAGAQPIKIDLSNSTNKTGDKASTNNNFAEDDPNNPIFDIDVSDDEQGEEDERYAERGPNASIPQRQKKKDGNKKRGDEDMEDDGGKEEEEDEEADRFAHIDSNPLDDASATIDLTGGGGQSGAFGDLSKGEDAGDEADTDSQNRAAGKLDPALLAAQLRDIVENSTAPVHILPLYSMLPAEEQMRIFRPPPPGSRLIVVSTNVAETSLTIPGITYVLDSGREKSKRYDRITGTSEYTVQWVSKASAAQRSGRSGRIGPGHAYRLYSSSVFDRCFTKFAPPEILRNPIESTVLHMKAMRIERIERFPFPTPPDQRALRHAIEALQLLGALERNAVAIKGDGTSRKDDARITELGKILSAFPVAPRFGKMMVLACNAVAALPRGSTASMSKSARATAAATYPLLSYMIKIVATLSVEQMFVVPNFSKDSSDEEEEDEVQDGDECDDNEEMHGDSESGVSKDRKNQSLSDPRATARAAKVAARESKRRLQKLYNESQARWRHPTSDVLTMLRALGGYEHTVAQLQKRKAKLIADASSKHTSEEDDGHGAATRNMISEVNQQVSQRIRRFISDNFLRAKALEEMQALQKQLRRIATDVIVFNMKIEEQQQQQQPQPQSSTDNSLMSLKDEKQYDSTIGEAEVTAATASSRSAFLSSLSSSSSSSKSSSSSPFANLLASLHSPSPLPPPSPHQESLLVEILCAGFIHQVARKMSPERKEAVQKEWANRKPIIGDSEDEDGGEDELNLAGAYECLSTSTPVFIHPSSLLFPPENQPDYLIYTDLIKTRKLYMRGCSTLPNLAILERYGSHLVTYSSPLLRSGVDPLPIYDRQRDLVLVWHDVYFGPSRWQLPRLSKPFDLATHGNVAARHFLRLLLSGYVVEEVFAKFRPFLLHKPTSITADDAAAAVNRTLSNIIAPFVARGIDRREKLESEWKHDPNFFLKEYLAWVQPSQHQAVKKTWPPISATSHSAKTSTSSKKKKKTV